MNLRDIYNLSFYIIKLLFTCQNQFDFFVKFTGYRQGKASGNAAFFRGIFNPDQIKESDKRDHVPEHLQKCYKFRIHDLP